MELLPDPSCPPRRVAVVGAGASGTLTAIQLLRAARRAGHALTVNLIDRCNHGRGVAYGTQDSRHRLNVPAGGMTAIAGDPDHFVRWSAANGRTVAGHEFVERAWYGRYLREALARERASAGPAALRETKCDAVQVVPAAPGDPLTIRFGDGTRLDADAVVLALGNAAPAALPVLHQEPRVIDDPWSSGALGPVARCTGRVLLVGTGLTMVDVALTLSCRCPDAELIAISRNGLLPRGHREEPGEPRDPVVEPRPGLRLVEVVAEVMRAVQREPSAWREVVDSLRPVTQAIWAALPLDDRRRFLCQYGRLWEVHRHRAAPSVMTELRRLIDGGRLEIRRGALTGASSRPAGRLAANVTADGRQEDLEVDWIVNCTGPDLDVRRAHEPLIRRLVESGQARPHALGLGFDVDADGRLVDGSGSPDPRLLAVGPLRRGALLETTAVPEIREQAKDLADLLLPGAARAALQAA